VYGSVRDEFADSTKPNSAWICRIQLKLWPFLWSLPILAKIWLPWQRPLHTCNQKCLLWIGRPRKPRVISNHIVAISCRNAFIAILVPKFVAVVTRFCPLYTGVPQMNSLIAQTLSQNQTLHEYVAHNWSYGHFVIFLPILANIWLPWQRPLDYCNQKCLLWIGRLRKPAVISSCILVISRRNAFICIYNNFSPKIGCRGDAALSLVYGGVTDEFPDVINPISKPNSVWICCVQLKLWPFLWYISLFWPKFGCHGNVP